MRVNVGRWGEGADMSSFVHRVELKNPVPLRNGDSMKMEVELHCVNEELIISKINAFFSPIEGGARMEELTIAGEHGILDHTGLSGPDKELMGEMGRRMAENIDRQILQSAQAVHDARSGASKFGDVAIMHPDTAADLLGDPLLQHLADKQIPAARDMPGEGWDEL